MRACPVATNVMSITGPCGNSKPRWSEPCFLLFLLQPTTSCQWQVTIKPPPSRSRLARAMLPSWRLQSSCLLRSPTAKERPSTCLRSSRPRLAAPQSHTPSCILCGEAMQADAPACRSHPSCHPIKCPTAWALRRTDITISQRFSAFHMLFPRTPPYPNYAAVHLNFFVMGCASPQQTAVQPT